MAVNKLSQLLGDYRSDSDNDDSDNRPKNGITTNWTQCIDANTGHPYYWNIVTKEVTWEMPTDYHEFLERAAVLYPNHLKNWILCYTDDNTPYYFNESTREILWEKPSDYVEPTPASSQKNTKNHTSGKEKKRSKSKTKSAKRNPFDEPIDEKIDLITSFENQSDSSTDGENPKSSEKPKNKLNLVPEYNSDDSDDESSKQSSQQPLFPASSNNFTAKSNQVKLNANKSDEKSDDTNKSRAQSPQSKHEHNETVPKPKPSFASIITGGRSPQYEANQATLEENVEETGTPPEFNSIETELMPQKTFQRKRRIEFNASNAKRVNTGKPPEENVETNVPQVEENKPKAAQTYYMNFQKGETEFSEPRTRSDSNDVEEAKETASQPKSDEIRETQSLLESKLKFLCQGHADVSPVQIIQIQLEALQAAHEAEALHPDYYFEWLKKISNDLIKLECDAAPSGWNCLWNREKAQYYYENQTTGDIAWEYPNPAVVESENCAPADDDEMDICTTPPPNIDEDIATNYVPIADPSTEAVPPPPPSWPTTEPPKTLEKPLDDELASFYSDIASLEPSTSQAAEENSNDATTTTNTPATDGGAGEESVGDDKKKKKKKKVKKLEPWRSGNLETWINKWQKAQKELEE